MKKLFKTLSVIMIVCLVLVAVVACDDNNGTGDGTGDGGNTPVHVDYVSQLTLDMSSTSLKQVVTVYNHVDGDTVHFNVPTSISANGVLKSGEYWAMGETLTQQRRVKEEGLRVVNFFYQGRINDGTWRKSNG